MWQDYVISIIGFSFGFMLIPMIRDSMKGRTVNIYSAGLTAFGLYMISICFLTLDLWLSYISNMFCATMWIILFYLSLVEKLSEKGNCMGVI